MILTKQQINRYMRHIIMPEISGQGQKKLLEAAVFVYGETVKDASSLIYYLSALGIGRIICSFQVCDGYEKLFADVQDLNEDSTIEMADNQLFERSVIDQTRSFRVFLGSIGFINRGIDIFLNDENENSFLPTIIAIKGQWKGILAVVQKFDELKALRPKLACKLDLYKPELNKMPSNNFDGSIIAASILGALCPGEVTKYVINSQETENRMLYFDTFSMEFSNIDFSTIDDYLEKMLKHNWDDNTPNESTEKKLSDCKVLIVGSGGLGSPVAFALAAAGIGTIGLVDYDTVELSNLNRQILHSTSRIGMDKVESAKVFLENINQDIKIEVHNINFNKDNAMEVMKDYDIIIDGVDNFQTRYLLNDACFFMKKPMIEAGVIRYSGLNTTIIPGEGHCYRCLFPNMPKGGSVPSCAESGVLGSVPGVMGFIQAGEAIKLAVGKGKILKDKVLFFDAEDLEFNLVNTGRKLDCPLCGELPSIKTLQEYEFICESKHEK